MPIIQLIMKTLSAIQANLSKNKHIKLIKLLENNHQFKLLRQ